MATQSGITISAPNAPFLITNDIPVPTLGPKTALVKSLYTGINPVESFMYHTGLLIEPFPAVLGSDAAGVVLATSPDCTKLRVGDYVYGCVPIGKNEFSPYQETFLVDERWIFKKAERISIEEASTIGAGVLTAGLLVLTGLDISLPSPDTAPAETDEWIVVMGGSGSVGRYVTQIARITGYKVVASSSKGKADRAISSGANATFDNRASEAEQLEAIKEITGGRFRRVVDASAQAAELSFKALELAGAEGTKYFATVDDWSPMEAPPSIALHRVKLGLLGRVGEPEGEEVTAQTEDMIRQFEPYFETGQLTALDYEMAEGTGWQAIIDALAGFEAGKFAKKVIVKVQDE